MANIRILTEYDWQVYKAIRLEALRLHPEAFGASLEDEANYADDQFRQRLATNTFFGAFIGNQIVGTAGFVQLLVPKMRHRGNLIGMYLKKEYRGSGIAGELLTAVIEHAKSKVIQLHCSVITTNIPAIKTYEKSGFKIYGTEPRSLKVDNQYHDEHLMAIMFDR